MGTEEDALVNQGNFMMVATTLAENIARAKMIQAILMNWKDSKHQKIRKLQMLTKLPIWKIAKYLKIANTITNRHKQSPLAPIIKAICKFF